MDFGLSDDQQLYTRALRGWLQEHVPLPRVRAIMESSSGHDASMLADLAAQGATGILCAEEHGGSALGLLDAAITAYEIGRAATPVSFHSGGVAAPLAIGRSENAEAKSRWLPALAQGKALLSFVVGAPAISAGRLSGNVLFAPDPAAADAFVVVTGAGSDREMVILPRATPGFAVTEMPTIDDTRRVGELSFDDVEIGDTQRLTPADPRDIDRVIDAARIALAADAFGAAERALEEAVRYSLTRRQFGRAVGSFQGVKHMCAEAYAEIEPVRAFLWYAAFAWDETREDSARMAALVKAHAAEVGTAAVTTAVQVFGGMGFTWECDAHLWFKRVGYDRQMLGGPIELRAGGTSLAAE